MVPDAERSSDTFAEALQGLERLRQYSGPPRLFWVAYLECLVRLAGAAWGLVLRQGGEEASAAWQVTATVPSDLLPQAGSESLSQLIGLAATEATERGYWMRALNGTPAEFRGDFLAVVRLQTDARQERWLAGFRLKGVTAAEAREALQRLRLAADLPRNQQALRQALEAQATASQLTAVFDLLALLNQQTRYLAAAMTFCNELAARHRCDRVSLGWCADRRYVRLQAISHTERFERKMEAVRAVEQTMEEAFDQEAIVVWPPVEGDALVTRDHGQFAESQKVRFLCSVPLRLGDDVMGVVVCERNTEAFGESEVRLLGLYAEMAARRLGDLQRADRWWGARWATSLRAQLGRLMGAEHTWAKAAAVLVVITLGVLILGGMTYRVEAPFILRADMNAMLSAPYDGYIQEVHKEVGETVSQGTALLGLDTRELRLEEAAATADLERFTREAEKARAGGALADMRVARAQADQARARLELVRYRLTQAEILAPFDGVLVEGDLRKRIAAPVKQGEVLFRLARTDSLYVECSVAEEDIHELKAGATGEIAFASQPKLKFPMQIERLEPAAQVREKGNVFLVRCRVAGGLEPWWRPGMSGVAKLNVGRRSFLWILTHRTVDFLRIYFWL